MSKMPDKKPTDAEIIKALECWSKVACEENCEKCSIGANNCLQLNLEEISLDLINRLQAENKKNENIIRLADKTIATLQAENENLNAEVGKMVAENERLKTTVDSFTDIGKLYSEIKAEAYKDCIEKVKCEIDRQPHSRSLEASGERFRIKKILDNLLKEMVGEDNVSKND